MSAIVRDCLREAEVAFAAETESLSKAEAGLWRETLAWVERDPLAFVPLWEPEPPGLSPEAKALAGLLSLRHCLMHRWLNPLDVGVARARTARELLSRVFRHELLANERFEARAARDAFSESVALRYQTERTLHPPPPCLVDAASSDDAGSAPTEVRRLIERWESDRAGRGWRRYLGDKLGQNIGFFRWGFTMPAYAWRRRRVIRALPASARRDATINETFSAIEEVGPVVDNFVFLGRARSLKPAPAAVADFAFLFMQLADEVVDNCAKHLGPEKLVALVEELYPESIRALSFTPLEEMDASTLRRVGIDPDAQLEKYSLSIAEMLVVLEDLRAAMHGAIDALPVERREIVRDDAAAFFRHCFATFLDELYLPRLGQGGMDRLDPRDTAWHFHRKNNEVMMRWLELRALAHGLDPVSHISRIVEWGYVLSNFQVFDDLKDVFVDLGMQPNYALQIASTRFPSEYDWLKANVARLGPDMSVGGVREVGVQAARTVMHSMRLSRLVALARFSWLTVYVWDQRWQRSWTSAKGSFNRADEASPGGEPLGAGEAGVGALAGLFVATRELAEYTDADEEYLAYVLDMFAFDHRGAVYAALLPSLRAVYRYHFLRMLISPKEKVAMLRRLLRRNRRAFTSALALADADLPMALRDRLHDILDVPAKLPASVAAKPGT